MHFLITLLVNAVLVLLAAYITPGIQIKCFGTALWIAFLVAILDPTLGWILTGLLHVATFGLFWLFGLGFILRFIAYIFVLRIIEALVSGFRTRGFWNVMAFAIVLAVLGTIVHQLFEPGGYVYPNESPVVMLR